MDIGKALLFEIAQIITGCLLAIYFYKHFHHQINRLPTGAISDILIIIAASFCGIILPLDIYGIIPILAIALVMGMRYYLILPLFMANMLFNLLVPFTNVGFVWRTGIYRVGLAFIVGIGSGIILRSLRVDKINVLRINLMEAITEKSDGFPNYRKFIGNYINIAGLYLIVGVISNTFFLKYVVYKLMNIVNIGSIASSVFTHMKGYDITKPVFLLTMVIFNMLINLKVLSGLLVLFKWRGILGYFLYYSMCILGLALLNIII